MRQQVLLLIASVVHSRCIDIYVQGISEISDGPVGVTGMNITALRLVDPSNQTSIRFLKLWHGLDPVNWPEAGLHNITVGRSFKLSVFVLT